MLTSRMLKNENGVEGQERSSVLNAFIDRHGSKLLGAARRYSESAADAEDAFQNAVEVLLSKAPDGFDDDRLLAWALTVTRNEALMERRRNAKAYPVAFDEIAERLVDPTPEGGDRAVVFEELGQAREALERVSPNQMRCLLLRAEGLDYPKICELTGFSYAKVNRCLSEGRKAFRHHVERIESGAECGRLDGVLSMMADGAASPEAVADAELHLKNCGACRATLRDYREIPNRAALGLPLGVALATGGLGSPSGSLFGRMADAAQSTFASLQERIAGHVGLAGQGSEIAIAKKAGAVVAAVAALVGGGVAVHEAADGDGAGALDSRAKQRSADVAKPLAGTQVDRVVTRERVATARRAKAATAEDIRRATKATSVRARTDETGVRGRSAGAGDDFDPQPATDEPLTTGSSDTETGLAP